MIGDRQLALVPRAADARDLDALARLWFDGWQDGHAGIVPQEVADDRTLDSFRGRLVENLEAVRTVGAPAAPLGFSLIRSDELYQFYVDRAARGSGVATMLMEDAEARLRSAGVGTAWLACAIGNARAARFYEKHGWKRVEVATIALSLRTGEFPIDVWRYEKVLSG
jgi:GNAT superfamily N-acetyltransferase